MKTCDSKKIFYLHLFKMIIYVSIIDFPFQYFLFVRFVL